MSGAAANRVPLDLSAIDEAIPDARVRDLFVRYLEETGGTSWIHDLRPSDYPSGQAILNGEPELRLGFVLAALDALTWSHRPHDRARVLGPTWTIHPLLTQLGRRRLPYGEGDVARVLDRLSILARSKSDVRVSGFLQGIEQYLANHGISAPVEAGLRGLQDALRMQDYYWGASGRKQIAQIDQLLAGNSEKDVALDGRDDWGFLAIDALASLDAGTRSEWVVVLRYAATATGSKPSGVWLKGAREALSGMPEDRFVDLVVHWLGLLRQPRGNVEIEKLSYKNESGFYVPSALVTEKNGDILKGLAWCCTVMSSELVAPTLGDAAAASFKKIPVIGARSTKVGNACIYALGALSGTVGVAQLTRLQQRVKLPSAQKIIDSALDAAARRNGLTRDDLEEIATPTFGLVDGQLRREVGNYTAELVVGGAQQVELTWRNDDEKALRTEPAEVKREYPDELKAMRRLQGDVRSTLVAQRDRIENQFLHERAWSLPVWQQRYLNHPLLGVLTRRLIWAFESGGRRDLGSWLDGGIVDVDDRPFQSLRDDTRVCLWHPIGDDRSIVLAWRTWLERHEVTQPFKQAHREVYVLTDAERATATYSNRFAAHILRQHQLAALGQERRWRYRLQGMFDGANAPTLDLPWLDLKVEFWCEGIEDQNNLSAAGIFRYVSSDSVRFFRPGGGEPVPLAEIPELVFSETMRDVDLFVGVCSVGNDPTWGNLDAGRYRQYWDGYAFGDLSETAQTRRTILKKILPRLTKIAAQCDVTDRFLVVRGHLRTYSIHLGSGNVKMDGNDQYLCIVPRAGGEIGTDRLFLPFEGDTLLAVILSKAFLLADDRSIKDPSILAQIRRA
jgi:hypothetical protein